MHLKITTKNLKLDPGVEKYAHRRLARLDRRLRQPVPTRLVLRHEKARRSDQRYIAEVTTDLKGAYLRGEERAASVEAAIDRVADVLDRQIKRYKARRKRRGDGLSEFESRIADQFNEISDAEEPAEVLEDGRVVREKKHPVTRMSVAEAAAQMDLLGHGFYLFLDNKTGDANVVYRRYDGDYGLIVPE